MPTAYLPIIKYILIPLLSSYLNFNKPLIPVPSYHNLLLSPSYAQEVKTQNYPTLPAKGKITFNIPAFFHQTVTITSDTSVQGDLIIQGNLVAPNIIQKLTAGKGIKISGANQPVITNTGVTSIQNQTGDILLQSGTGITISDDLKISVNLTAGSGISISGNKIENTDKGSSQNIFKTITVSGQDDITASSNSDTLTFAAGTGISLTTDAANKKLTITSNNPNVAAGWTNNGTTIYLTSSATKVGIGTTSPSEKLEVAGNAKITGSLTAYGINNQGGGITNAGPITGATGFTSSGQITFSDLSTGILHANINGVISSSPVDLSSADVSNTLPTSKGGTGITSYSKGDILYASATNTLSTLPIGGEGQVLIISSGTPAWGSITGGTNGVCTNCLVSDPGSTQTITPTATDATGLVIRQAQNGTVDIFKVTDYTGNTSYLRIDSSGDVILGNGGLSVGTFTVNPSGTDPIAISPTSAGSTAYTGTITSSDLTQNRTWTFPDLSGQVCLSAGNCSGTSASIGGSGTANYLAKWQGTYSITNSIIYDDGTNVGIGTTSPSYKLHITGTGYFSGALSLGSTLTASGAATLQNTLTVNGAVDFNSTLGVAGATTLSSTLDVTGNTTIGGNLTVNGTGNSYFAGNVGIGTTSPQSILNINGGTGSLATGLTFGNGDTGIYEISDNSLVFWFPGSADQWRLEYWGFYNTRATGSIGLRANVQNSPSLPTYSFNGDWDTGMYRAGTNELGFATAGTARIVIDSTGNVGIGTNSPTAKLHVEGAVTGKALAIFNETGDQNILVASASGQTKFVITNSGNVGIGTTSPGAKLEILSGSETAFSVKNTTGKILFAVDPVNAKLQLLDSYYIGGFTSTGTRTGWLQINLSHFTLTAENSAYMKLTTATEKIEFAPAATTSMILQPTGLVGIGTTSPTAKLHVEGAVTGKALAIFNETGDQAILTASASGSTKFIITNSGQVGINTASPEFALTVLGDGGIIAKGSYSTGPSLSLSGSGAKLIWYPKKAAFRAGYVIGTQWDDSYIGAASIAMGYNTQASGSYSIALGLNSTASSSYAVAIGNGNTASGFYSIALGSYNTSSGYGSSALGYYSTASGNYSTSFGERNSAAGDYSVAFGKYMSLASTADRTFVFGYATSSYSIFTSDVFLVDPNDYGIKVGIGLDSPEAKLHVDGAVTGKALAIFNETGDQNILVASASGQTKFVITNSGNVGIGTESPQTKLHIKGGVVPSIGQLYVEGVDNNGTWVVQNTPIGTLASWQIREAGNLKWDIMFNGSDDSLSFKFNNGPVMSLLPSGNVGIGTTSPTAKLHVNGAVTGKALAVFNETGDQNILVASASGQTKFIITNSGSVQIAQTLALNNSEIRTDRIINTTVTDPSATVYGIYNTFNTGTGNLYAIYNNLTSDGVYSIYGTYNYGNATGLASVVTGTYTNITASGSNSKGYGSDITLTASGTGTQTLYGTKIRFKTDSSLDTAYGIYIDVQTTSTAGTQYGVYMNLNDADVTRYGIYETGGATNYFAGSVGIGTASPTAKLHVEGAVTGKALAIFNETGDQAVLTASVSGQTKFIIANSGNVGIATSSPGYALQVGTSGDGTSAIANAWNVFSDIRLKTNITPINNALNKILNINGVYFNWKSSNQPSLGVIAQEVQQVFPEIVSQDSNGYLSVDYAKLAPVLIEAVKQQQQQITQNTIKIDQFGNIIFPQNITQQLNNLSTQSAQTQKQLSIIDVLKHQIQTITQKLTSLTNQINSILAQITKLQNSEASGSIVLPKNTKKVKIKFPQPFSQTPVVFISTPNFQLPKFNITQTTPEHFIITFHQPLTQDITVNWFARISLNTQPANLEIIETQPASPNPIMSPSPTQNPPAPTPTPTQTQPPTPTPTNTPTPALPTLTPSPLPTTTPTPVTPTLTPSPTPTPPPQTPLSPTSTPSAQTSP